MWRAVALLVASVVIVPSPAWADDAPPKKGRHVGEGPWSGWKTTHLVEGGVFGLMPNIVRTTAPASTPATNAGGLVASATEVVMRSWYPGEDKSLRFSLDGAIGADSSGFAGAIAHDAMGGFRYALKTRDEGTVPRRLTDAPGYRELPGDLRADLRRVFRSSPHSIFARGGYHLHAMGDQAWFSARIELPRLELGWAFDGGMEGFSFEARLEGGFVPFGRFHVDAYERGLGATGTAGTRLVLHAKRQLHMDLGVQRLFDPASTPSTPVDVVDAKSCVRLVPPSDRDGDRAFMKAVCALVRLETTEIVGGGRGGRASAGTAGILLSLPWISP